ncbi:cathepsin O-like [Lingula anatina]|uniref:Cathepsin O-like n=1 Tax=Lingula anatina TaxID=7574 RepID=A0A1S3IVU0_LINAN|nr:cathepsin O-like [Lingula anatina]|eukprot:XP_013402312.1 cathepsin O-like [Lingula anatina]
MEPPWRSHMSSVLIFMTVIFISSHYFVTTAVTDVEQKFKLFIKKYQKPYKTGSEEYYKRLKIFQDSLKKHHQLNSLRTSNHSAIYGVTKFSDLTDEEFIAQYLDDTKKPLKHHLLKSQEGYVKNTQKQNTDHSYKSFQPQKWDWRTDWKWPVITKVKNQRSCGGCWAFSSVESVETMYAIKTKDLRDLSVQQVIDCAAYGNFGCRGGDTCHALYWMKLTRTPLVTDQEYPLTDTSDFCKIESNATKGVSLADYTCDKFINHGQSTEGQMVSMLLNGPLTISVDATSWKDYLGGIIQYHCYNFNNHAVQIIGYDLTGPVPYFIIRNSWGDDFGLNGYIHIRIGNNVCGVAEEVSSIQV